MALLKFHFLPSYIPSTEANPRDQYYSIWEPSQVISNHTWAIRALQAYSVLVTLQRKIKIWLTKKRVFALHPLLPCGSALLNTILQFLCQPHGCTHPTILVSETSRGALYVLSSDIILPFRHSETLRPFSFWPVPWHNHLTQRFIIPLNFSRTYNALISDSALLTSVRTTHSLVASPS